MSLVAATLHRVLAGEAIEPAIVQQLAREQWREGIRHDFKSGKLFDDAKGRRRLVWDAAAFANADGGLLVIGVGEEREGGRSEGPRLLDPVPASVRVDERLGDILRPISTMLRPPPRWQTVEVDGGRVVLLAAPRSEQLVAASEPDRGEQAYPLRFGDGTHRCPEYLVSDLRLGRRERPEFLLEPLTAKLNVDRQIPYPAEVEIRLRLANVGLTWIDESLLFVIGPGRPGEAKPLPPHLHEAVEIHGDGVSLVTHSVPLNAPERQRIAPFGFIHGRFSACAPFDSLDARFLGFGDAVMWPAATEERKAACLHATRRFELLAGLCVVVRGAAPRWFQLSANYFSTAVVGELAVAPAEGRPVVAFTATPNR